MIKLKVFHIWAPLHMLVTAGFLYTIPDSPASDLYDVYAIIGIASFIISTLAGVILVYKEAVHNELWAFKRLPLVRYIIKYVIDGNLKNEYRWSSEPVKNEDYAIKDFVTMLDYDPAYYDIISITPYTENKDNN